MSLTSFLSIPEVKTAFLKEFQKPEFTVHLPIKATPQTNRYALIGTAFDYLLRFILLQSNPSAKERKWVAMNSLFILKNKDLEKAVEIISEAQENQRKYCNTGIICDELMASCIKLGQLDSIYRAGYVDPNLGIVDNLDVCDLKNLTSIVNLENFKANKMCLLNPTFGKASALVGGADCDLIIDDMLIDIKTVKNLEVTRDYFNQLIGYYILSRIAGIDDAPKEHKIKRVAIYFSRHGYLHTYNIADIVNENNMNKFIKWFTKNAQIVFEDEL